MVMPSGRRSSAPVPKASAKAARPSSAARVVSDDRPEAFQVQAAWIACFRGAAVLAFLL